MGSDPILYQNLRRLINVVDGLRDVGLQQYINLPRICVVGTQSAGKSSILEAIVGMDFLPRGEGVVTRRPLELRLVHMPENSVNGESKAWAVFEERKDKVYTDFELVRQTIEELTEEAAGCNKGIIADPIVLEVHSTHCPDLTLIDLPGITRVPLKGSDQTDDIERHTRAMASRYARDPRTIILAVVAANADMSTSDALQLARMEDPRGVRTIGVITKIDLMDKGTNAKKMLSGDEVPLRLGYTGVRNRSQADIKACKSIQEALMEEKEFFQNHPVYRTLPPAMTGTQSLIDKLTGVLFRHIRSSLPDIRREIHVRLRAAQDALDDLGRGVPLESQERVQLMWAMITDYCEVFRNTIRGKFDKKIQAYSDLDITSGAQIRGIFNELLQENVGASITRDMSDYDIDAAIRMHEGDSLPGFPSPDTFEYLILPYLKTIQAPVFDCLDRVAQALETLSQTVASRVFARFPRLADQVLEQASQILQRQKRETKVILENIVTAEIGYLFTNDGTYLSEHGSMIPIKDKQTQGSASSDGLPAEQEANGVAGRGPSGPYGAPGSAASGQSGTSAVVQNAASAYNSLQNTVHMWTGGKKTHYSSSFIKEIRSRLDAYFSIVLRNVRDSVPKIIGCFLVRQLQDKLQFELYNELNKADRMADLLSEPPHIMERRLCLVQQIDTFNKAIQVLQRDPGVTLMGAGAEFDEAYDRDLAQSQRDAELRKQQQQQHKGYGHAPPAAPAQQQQQQRYDPHGRQPGAGARYPQQQPPQAQQLPPQQQTVPPPPAAATVGNLWGLRSGSKTAAGTANPADAKKSGMSAMSGNLFGDRTLRTDTVGHLFSDTKPNNPLYS